MSENTIVVIDTNIVLDLWLFSDPRCADLRDKLQVGKLHWIATAHMRAELERVLDYPHLVAKLQALNKNPLDVLAEFDQYAKIVPTPRSKAPYSCKDSDDQPFIDLACEHKAQLLSKDKAVLAMKKRLEKLTVLVHSQWVS